jgi:hypothetical protein
MHIGCPMACDTRGFQVLSGNRSGVARVTLYVLMLPLKGPLGITDMIERSGLPLLIPVARPALFAQPRSVRVLPLVATVAVLRYGIVQAAAAVAVRTVQASVHAFEREPCFLGVIELCCLPGDGRMAVGALGPALTAMYIIGRVARHALRGCFLVTVSEVARETGDVLVLVP